jgi:hypothetical protein
MNSCSNGRRSEGLGSPPSLPARVTSALLLTQLIKPLFLECCLTPNRRWHRELLILKANELQGAAEDLDPGVAGDVDCREAGMFAEDSDADVAAMPLYTDPVALAILCG